MTGTRKSPVRAGRLQRHAPRAIGASGAIVLVIGVVLVALAGRQLIGGGAALPGIELEASAFPAAVEAAVADQGLELRLPPVRYEEDAAIGLDVATVPLRDWALLEVYRDADGQVAAVELSAQPRSVADDALFDAAAVATIAAVLETDVARAVTTFEEDLGATRTGAGALDERVEVDGVALLLQREVGTWQLRVTAAADAG